MLGSISIKHKACYKERNWKAHELAKAVSSVKAGKWFLTETKTGEYRGFYHSPLRGMSTGRYYMFMKKEFSVFENVFMY